MSLTSFLYTRAIYPLVSPTSYGGLSQRLHAWRLLETRSLDENLHLQWLRVLKVLAHAYDSVPFYKERFHAAGVSPATLRTPDDLSAIPLLTREDIQQNFANLRSSRFAAAKLSKAATGGTTDSPVPLLRSPDCVPARNAAQWQFNAWAGVAPGDKIFWLWGAAMDYPANPSWRWVLFDRYLMRRIWAQTSRLPEEVLADYARKLDSFRPKAIIAYPSPLAAFCEYLLATGYRGFKPASVICTAEPVLAEQRQIIEKALNCKVFEHYGTRDFGMVAAECELHDGLHVHPEAVFVEGQPIPGAPEGLQELVVTDLLNPGFPLIRYKINDCIYPRSQRCSCGRGFPLISHIEGRVADNFHLPGGLLVPGVSFTNRIIKTASGIKKVQVIQEREDLFVIKYIPDATFAETSLHHLREKLILFLGGNVAINFEKVAEIPREKSGKTRVCISKVRPASVNSQASSAQQTDLQ